MLHRAGPGALPVPAPSSRFRRRRAGSGADAAAGRADGCDVRGGSCQPAPGRGPQPL